MATDPDLIFVDLDGSLILTDITWEGFWGYIRYRPWRLGLILLWLIKGRANLKSRLAEKTDLRPDLLPYNEKVLNYLKEKKANGKKIVLATASALPWARQVQQHVSLLDDVIGTESGVNLRGAAKLSVMQKYANGKPFAYIGNSIVDFPVFEGSAQAILVNSTPALERRLTASHPNALVIPAKGSAGAWLRAIRIHQWSKNLLIFAPVIAIHKIFDPEVMSAALLAFLGFSFAASAVYLLNDLYDLNNDRSHTTKKNRPLAAGTIFLPYAMSACGIFIALFLFTTWFLPISYLYVGLCYLVLAAFYSFCLKNVPMVDVTLLALLYTLRVLAGGAATGIVCSNWLLAFCSFLSLSLALLKRYVELNNQDSTGGIRVTRPGYQSSDVQILSTMGIGAGLLSSLVLALYINAAASDTLYHRPELLLLLCLGELYWIGRTWLLAHRNEMHEDPVEFIIKDKQTYVFVGAMAFIVAAAKYI